MATPLVPVQFLTADGCYNAGEIAGFDAKLARRLIDKKIARAYLPNAPVVKGADAAPAEVASAIAGLDVKPEASSLLEVPTLEEVVEAGYEPELAQKIVDVIRFTLSSGKSHREADEAATEVIRVYRLEHPLDSKPGLLDRIASAVGLGGEKKPDADVTQPSLEPALIAAEERKLLPEVEVAPHPLGDEVLASEAAIEDGKLTKRGKKK